MASCRVADALNICSASSHSPTLQAPAIRALRSGQVCQALLNIVAVLAEAKAGPVRIVRMAHYPAMTAVQVGALVEDWAKVEIEVTAVVPDVN